MSRTKAQKTLAHELCARSKRLVNQGATEAVAPPTSSIATCDAGQPADGREVAERHEPGAIGGDVEARDVGGAATVVVRVVDTGERDVDRGEGRAGRAVQRGQGTAVGLVTLPDLTLVNVPPM